MPELVVDFITSLDGYAAAEGWPGWWGLEGPEYLAWLGESPEADYLVLMGANTYRLMHGFTKEGEPGTDVLGRHVQGRLLQHVDRTAGVGELDLGRRGRRRGRAGDEGERRQVDAHHRQPHTVPFAAGSRPRRPVPGGDVPGHHRCHRPGTDLRRLPRRRPRHEDSRTFDGQIQLVEYVPRVLDGPPGFPPDRPEPGHRAGLRAPPRTR